MLGCKGLVSHVIGRACWRKEVSVLTVSRVEVLLLLGASFSEKFPKLMRGTGVPFGFPVSILSDYWRCGSSAWLEAISKVL